MKKRLIHSSSILIVAMALLVSACGMKNPFAASDKVNVQLSWFHSVEYAGFYTAIEKGYYKDENIETTLIAGGPTIDPLSEVNSGNAQFGISTGDSLVIARTNQKNLLAVATIFRNNPLVIMSLSNENIIKPEDLTGKNIGVIAPDLSSNYDIQFLALLNRIGLNRDSMNFSAIEDYNGAAELTSGKLDAMSSMFATNEPIQAQLNGDKVNLIYYKDYGVDVYANALFTTDEFAKNNPDLTARFIRATMKGYQYAIEHPEEVASFALKYDPTLDLALQQETMKAQIPFIDTGSGPIGSMDENVWNTTQDILLEFKLIQSPIDLSTVYTNKFVTP